MTDRVKADYEALSDAANRFSQESDRIKQIAGRLGHGAENLKRTSWTGKGAEAFFKEVEGSILPAYRRLADALKEGSTILKALSKLFQDAEQEASGFVKGTGGGSAGGGADGGEGAGTAGGGIADAVAAAMGAAFGGSAGGAGAGAAAGGIGAALAAAFNDAFGGGSGGDAGDAGTGGDGDLDSFPGTLQEALQNALGGAGLKPSGNIITIVLQKGQGMADTGMQYGADQSGAGGGGPSGAGDAGAGAAQPTMPQETPSSGGGGGGSPESGFGGGGQGGGASMVEGGSVGTPMGGGQAFWFGATPGSRLSSPVVAAGVGSVAAGVPAGGDALGLLASFGATAGAAVLGIVGKSVMGKGLRP